MEAAHKDNPHHEKTWNLLVCCAWEREIPKYDVKVLVCLVFLFLFFVKRNQIHRIAFKDIKIRRTGDIGTVGEKLSC